MQEQYRVEILPTAWEDLKKIEDYYLLQFGVESAMKVTDQILNSVERLELYPDSGSLTPDKWLNRKVYRMVTVSYTHLGQRQRIFPWKI